MLNLMFKRKKFSKVWEFPGFLTWTFFFFGFLYIPIVILVIYSFNSSKFAMIWTGFSFRWYEKLLTNDDMQQAALNSLYVAFVAAPCATAIATLTALVVVRGGSFKSKEFSNGLVTLPLMAVSYTHLTLPTSDLV